MTCEKLTKRDYVFMPNIERKFEPQASKLEFNQKRALGTAMSFMYVLSLERIEPLPICGILTLAANKYSVETGNFHDGEESIR